MTDRELLEKAAKAAGIRAAIGPDGVMRDATGFDGLANVFIAPRWNPLEDDGDALRLAVKLRLVVDTREDGSAAYIKDHMGVRNFGGCPHGEDPYAATRRAIVRAAASLAGG